MNVGILTFHKSLNYGAVLQAYALKTTLQKIGTNPLIIDRYAGYKSLLQRLYFTFHPLLIINNFKWIRFSSFAKANLIPKTDKYKSDDSIISFEYKENLNAIIVGSDQVWRMEFSTIGYNYFLDFITNSNIKKISYAASFGKDKWIEEELVTNHIKNLLQNFRSISVREKTGVSICSDIFKVKAEHVLDPTLLLDRSDYELTLLKKYPHKTENSLVSYFLGNNQKALIYCNTFAKKNNLEYSDLYYTYPLNSLFSEPIYGSKNYIHISVPRWLSEIRNSKFIITNSFHATVFAIIFGKQFIVVDHPDGGTTRINSLLNLLGLESRFISDISNISINLFNNPIDYNLVYSKLEVEKKKSLNFLVHSLFN